jgi:hypothetical protein
MAEYTNDMFGLQQLMRDEEAAKEQAAINNAVNLAGTPRASMLANTINIAEGQGNSYANIGRMLTGEGAPIDPRVERMQRLDSIADQMPDPQTEEDYLKLAEMLRAADLPGEAQKAMEMVKSIRSAASTAASATYKDVENATRFVATGQLVPGESATKKLDAPSFDDEINQAVLEGYIATETKKLMDENSAPMNNATRLSQDEIIATGIANGKREYNRVENAPAAGSQSAFSEKLAVWDSSTAARREELTEAGFFDGDNMEIVIQNAISSEGEPAYNKKAGELMAQADIDLAATLSPALNTLKNTNQVFATLDSGGTTTGIGSTLVTNAKRIGNQIMKALGQKDLISSDVSDDQYLEALLGSQVFAMIKTLGIGARGLDTPAERDFLISVMTGARTMDKEAIMRLTRLRREIATDAIQKWNEKVQNGSLDNYIILNRKLKDDGSDEFKAKFAQAKNDFIQEVPEMYKGTWDRPVEGVRPVINNGETTEYVSWDGRYYDSENKEISIEDLDKILNPKGGE